MAEVLIYSNALAVADRQVISTYLNYKYRLLTNTPVAPSNFLAQAVSSNQVMLTWEGMVTNHGLTYVIERRVGKTGQSIQVAHAAEDTSYFDTNTLPNTEYYYRVKAMNFWTESATVETSVTTTNTVEMPVGNLKLWLRGDAGIVLQQNGLACWLAQHGTNDAVQFTNTNEDAPMGTNQPGYLRIETNGRPAIVFNQAGTNEYLRLLNGWPNNTPAEVYLVHKAAVTNSNTQGFCDFGTESSHVTQYPDQNGKIVENFGSNQKRTSPNAVSGLNQYHLYQVISKSGAWTNRVNGVDVQTDTVNMVAFPTTPTIGRSGNSGSFKYFSGNIAEILIFTNILSSNQNFTVTNYLKQKYNLP